MEVQLNGVSIADKVDFARYHFEKEVPVGAVAVVSEPGILHCVKSWTEGIPPQDRDQQEDLQDGCRICHEGWKSKGYLS